MGWDEIDGMKEENAEEKLDENIILELDAQKASSFSGLYYLVYYNQYPTWYIMWLYVVSIHAYYQQNHNET